MQRGLAQPLHRLLPRLVVRGRGPAVRHLDVLFDDRHDPVRLHLDEANHDPSWRSISVSCRRKWRPSARRASAGTVSRNPDSAGVVMIVDTLKKVRGTTENEPSQGLGRAPAGAPQRQASLQLPLPPRTTRRLPRRAGPRGQAGTDACAPADRSPAGSARRTPRPAPRRTSRPPAAASPRPAPAAQPGCAGVAAPLHPVGAPSGHRAPRPRWPPPSRCLADALRGLQRQDQVAPHHERESLQERRPVRIDWQRRGAGSCHRHEGDAPSALRSTSSSPSTRVK